MERTDENLEILNDFIAEGLEMLDGLDSDIMLIENALDTHSKPDLELFHSVFRTFHSIKGAAGFLNLSNIEEVTHHAESTLDLFRKGKASITKQHITLFLNAEDLLRKMLIEAQDKHHDQDFEKESLAMVGNFKKHFPKKGEDTVIETIDSVTLHTIHGEISSILERVGSETVNTVGSKQYFPGHSTKCHFCFQLY